MVNQYCEVYSCDYATDVQNFSSYKMETLYPLNDSHFLLPESLTNSILLYVSKSLTILDIIYLKIWSHLNKDSKNSQT